MLSGQTAGIHFYCLQGWNGLVWPNWPWSPVALKWQKASCAGGPTRESWGTPGSPRCFFWHRSAAPCVVPAALHVVVIVVVEWSGVHPLHLCLQPSLPPSPYLYLAWGGIKKPCELMKMSEVIKRGGDGDTDPERVSEGQEVHMGPRPAWSTITLLPSSVPLVPRLHGTQIWLDWPAGHRRRRVGEVGTQGRWRERQGGGVDWAQASPVAPEPLPGYLPWQPGHAAWSKHPLPGEERRKTTAWREERCIGRDGGDEGGRAWTIGALPGIMAPCWPNGVQPWWTSDWQALALL